MTVILAQEMRIRDAILTPEMAARPGKLCGNGPRLWLNLQSAYDLWHAERRIGTRRIPTLHAAE